MGVGLKKIPGKVRQFEILTVLTLLGGLVYSWFNYVSIASKVNVSFIKSFGPYTFAVGAITSASMRLLLAYAITRKRIDLAKWIYIVLFVLGVPTLLMKLVSPTGFETANYVSVAIVMVQGYMVYLLFTNEFKDWLDKEATAAAKKPRRKKKPMGLSGKMLISGLVLVMCICIILVGLWLKPLMDLNHTKFPKIEDKVLVGAGFFNKSPFFQDQSFGRISDIAVGQLDPDPRVKLGVCGQSDAAMLDGEGKVIKTVSPGLEAFREGKIIPRQDNQCLFLNRGSWSSAPALYSHAGEKLWQFKRTANGSVAGDFEGDGHLKYAFCDEGDLHLLDESGKELWTQNRGWIWHVEIASLEHGQKPELILNGRDSDVVVMDEDGKEVSRNKTTAHISHFSLIPWPNTGSNPAILQVENESLAIVKPSGEVLMQWAAPECKSAVGGQAVWFQATATSPTYLVAMVEVVGGSVLIAYDTAGKIVYEETRSANSGAMAVYNTPTGLSLLVGGNGEVTKFTLAAPRS